MHMISRERNAILRRTFIVLVVLFFSHFNFSKAEIIDNAEIKHNMLFDFFFPKDVNLTQDQLVLRERVRTILWEKLGGNIELCHAVETLSVALTQKDKNFLHLNSDDQAQASLLFKLRKLYLSHAYSDEIANSIAGITLPPVIRERKQQLHQEKHLLFKQKLISHNKGPIDFLIVGSGPAGSLVAHELRFQYPDSHIVVLEAGSWVDPSKS